MKQVLVLTRMQLGGALDFLNMKRREDRRKNVSAVTILFFGCVLFMFISGSYCYAMATVMNQTGQLDVLPGFFMAVTSIMTLITSLMKAKGILFGFKDYDILMSLPVKASYIVASRLLQLYIINMVFTIGIMLPCYVIYGTMAHPKATFYVLGIIGLLLIPCIPMVIASIFGVLIGMVSSRFKYSNVISTVIMLLAFTAFFFGTFAIQSDEQIINIGTVFSDRMKSMYPIAQWFYDGVVHGELAGYLLFTVSSVLVFVLFSMVLGKCFKKVNTSISAIHSGTKYKMKELKQNGVFSALLMKEAKRYFTCSIYVFNTAFGLFIAIIAAIGIHVVKIDEIDVMVHQPEVSSMIRPLLPYTISMMVGMCAITASSISLEGKNLWIIKSAPISIPTYLNAKICLQDIITMPIALLTSISLEIKFEVSFTEMLFLVLIPLIYCHFGSVFGLMINLKFPLMEWKNETVVVKQSAASMITIFSSFLIIGIPAVATSVCKKQQLTLVSSIVALAFAGASILCHRYITKQGEKIIARL